MLQLLQKFEDELQTQDNKPLVANEWDLVMVFPVKRVIGVVLDQKIAAGNYFITGQYAVYYILNNKLQKLFWERF